MPLQKLRRFKSYAASKATPLQKLRRFKSYAASNHAPSKAMFLQTPPLQKFRPFKTVPC
jgi:hypothetical protein